MSLPSLKPCPFCGGSAEVKLIGNDHTRRRAAKVRCTTFGCQIDITVGAIRNGHIWCVDRAADQWNTRTQEATQ